MILDAITNKTQNVHFTIPSPSSEKPLAEVDQLKTPTLVMTSLIRHFKNILLRPLLFGQSTEFIRLDQIFLSLSVNNLEVNYCLNKENMNAEADRKFLKWHVLAYYLIILAVYATTNKYRSTYHSSLSKESIMELFIYKTMEVLGNSFHSLQKHL